MKPKRTFYRNIITVEVLSEEPLSGNESLSDIEYLINEGPCSGKVETTTDNEQVDGRRMAPLLQDQGSDTEFFGLDEQGRDVDGDEEEEAVDGENSNDIQEPLYEGEVSVELTGLAAMRQRRIIRLEKLLPQSAVEDLARETAENHVWDYQGMQDETIEVTILS
ncbi:MAG: hypothetical protein H0U76_22225 [Ktedonobacteraceae bacterium]|nr:hypothetical protein [Ktedonobacteraceae bacterium]